MPQSSSTPMVDESTVRTRAYLMWESDGRPDGRAEHYWQLAYSEALAPARRRPDSASAGSPVPAKKSKSEKAAKAGKKSGKSGKSKA